MPDSISVSHNKKMPLIVKVAIPSAPHFLGESFSYLVPDEKIEKIDSQINDLFGFLVSVDFRGRKTNGFIVGTEQNETVQRTLKPVIAIVSNVALFTKASLEIYSEIAQYYGTNVAKILNFAIPSRTATAEKVAISSGIFNPDSVDEFDTRRVKIAKNLSVERSFSISPAGVDNGIPRYIHDAAMFAKTAIEGERRVIFVFAEVIEVELFEKALYSLIPQLTDSTHELFGKFCTLHSSLKPADLYSNFLKILAKKIWIVAGTRQCALAPMDELTDIVICRDYDSNHKERRSPFQNSREIALIRSEKQFADLKLISQSVSLCAARWFSMDYFTNATDSVQVRVNSPQIEIMSEADFAARGEAGAKIPSSVVRQVRTALESGPVLFVTPFNGYFNMLICSQCSQVCLCQKCGGSLKKINEKRPPICSKCITPVLNFCCSSCMGTKIKTVSAGAERLEFEIGKLFPGVAVKLSSPTSAAGRVNEIDDKPKIIVAKSGFEPIAKNGYQMCVILDADKFEFVGSLDGSVDAVNKLLKIVSLVKSNAHSGKALLLGHFETQFKNALISYDPLKIVNMELKQREINSFPPYSRIAAIVTLGKNVEEVTKSLKERGGIKDSEIIGPFALSETNYSYLLEKWTVNAGLKQNATLSDFECVLVRVPIARSRILADALRICQNDCAAKRMSGELKILLDPKEFL